MPYFISDSNPECGGWAVEKSDGEIIGCHESKQDAVDQMVAVSIAEGIEPGGERSKSYDVTDEEPLMDRTPVSARMQKSNVEFRETTCEFRADEDGGKFVGYAAMFNSPSQPLPFIERIAPGAFSRSIRQRRKDIRLYINHNSDMVLASRRSNTLNLVEDDRGLQVEATLPDTTYARDLRALMESGVVDKMSFGFHVPRGGDTWNEAGTERVLNEVVLHEVSVVTGFPAYEATSAAVRSLQNLAIRTGLDLDDLTEAIDALANGDELTAEKSEILMNAIKSSTPRTDEPEEKPNLLAIKKLQLDLLAKKDPFGL